MMVKQRILGAVAVTVLVSAGGGCDEDKKAPAAAASAAASTSEPVAESPPELSAKPAVPEEKEEVIKVNPMVRIAGGVFIMGSKDGQRDEKPPRRVRVRTFELDVTEVTLGAYMACIKEQKCTHPDYDSFCTWGKKGHLNYPMNCVDWDQAKAYCEAVGKRLPTEEEWEYAARGKKGRTYSWGNGPPPEGLCFNRPKKGTCKVTDVPVDSPHGLRGMAGNVWEWTASKYSEDYSKKRDDDRRVYRGASYVETDKEDLRATLRNMRAESGRFDHIGFRCARTPKPGGK